MKLGSLHSKTLATLILLLLVNAALSFDIALFFPGSTVYSGTSLQLRIQNGPSRVNVKFAVQNTDNTLTSIESSTVYNVAPDSMATVVRVSNDIKPGINYWVVAVDASNAESYATYGPFSIFQMLGGNPSASVTVGSGTSYATAGGSAATPSATGQTSSSKPTSTASSTTKGSATGTSESTPKSSPGEGDDPGSLIKLSLGTIVGIAVGGAVGGAILGLLAYYILFKKCRQPQPVLPVAPQPTTTPKPENNSGNNSSIVPITALPSETVSVNLDSKPTLVPITELKASQIPSPQLTESTLNASSETTFKYQHPSTNFATQPEYPPYSYPNNSNQYDMSYYPPMNDSMPIPEHHYGANGAYQPLSPTFYNYPSFHQQQYPPYPPNQLGQLNAGYNPFHTSKEATEAGARVLSNDNTVLAQKVEYDGVTADNKAEYHQKPDTAIDEQPVYTKPNQRSSR